MTGTWVALHTFGCKLNQAETEALGERLEEHGFRIVPAAEQADVYVVNTCTVTHVADRKVRHWLRLARRRSPDAYLVATGCYVERIPEELTGLADLVVDNEEKCRIPDLLQGLLAHQAGHARGHSYGLCGPGSTRNGAGRVRSLVKIQAGCAGACSYCVVPKVRPGELSVPLDTVLREVRRRAALGYREVVLTGTKVGRYRSNGEGLRELVTRILAETDVERVRLSSLQPGEITSGLVELWQDGRLCRHFHLSLQSGSDVVLRNMRRGYTANEYLRALELIRQAVPEAAVTSDLIVGFPRESEEDFEQSLSVCREAGFAGVNVFPYSARPGTEAAQMGGQVDEKVKKVRVQKALELGMQSRQRFNEGFLGSVAPVLWEKEVRPGSGVYSGLTDTYIRVFTQSSAPLTNRVTQTRLVRAGEQHIWGEALNEDLGSGEARIEGRGARLGGRRSDGKDQGSGPGR
ncbi:MAG: tRNA (N(6)-L-threonylcarbamoyladenosine(37)-C(2))-methylthiotransferase MtaB [Chloroflexota bacterium]